MDATEIARVDRKAPRLQPRPSGGLQCTFNFSSAQVRLECGKTRQWGPEFDKLDFRPSGAEQCGKTVVACRGSPPWLLWPGRAATVDLRPRAALPRLAPPSLRLCSSSPAGPWQVLLPARSSPDNTLSAKNNRTGIRIWSSASREPAITQDTSKSAVQMSKTGTRGREDRDSPRRGHRQHSPERPTAMTLQDSKPLESRQRRSASGH
ncbi:uncharacterized protein LOC124510109 [Lynx rufus]|uniref:uncharacterized protein LOC124510109 n=1 Tax=Lynx rufus TaxID=61384 RepID=UPI001F124085|nr:uncharacterized protein LOC124510109 [Lynx rufus]